MQIDFLLRMDSAGKFMRGRGRTAQSDRGGISTHVVQSLLSDRIDPDPKTYLTHGRYALHLLERSVQSAMRACSLAAHAGKPVHTLNGIPVETHLNVTRIFYGVRLD